MVKGLEKPIMLSLTRGRIFQFIKQIVRPQQFIKQRSSLPTIYIDIMFCNQNNNMETNPKSVFVLNIGYYLIFSI